MQNQNSESQNSLSITGFCCSSVNSNNPGTVTTYPARIDIIPFTYRSTKLINEQAELCRQVEIADAWKKGLRMGVIR
jgi:hypothetical protein